MLIEDSICWLVTALPRLFLQIIIPIIILAIRRTHKTQIRTISQTLLELPEPDEVPKVKLVKCWGTHFINSSPSKTKSFIVLTPSSSNLSFSSL